VMHAHCTALPWSQSLTLPLLPLFPHVVLQAAPLASPAAVAPEPPGQAGSCQGASKSISPVM